MNPTKEDLQYAWRSLAAEDMLHALHVALPFLEDCKDDHCYKPGYVDKALKTIQAAIHKATTGDIA